VLVNVCWVCVVVCFVCVGYVLCALCVLCVCCVCVLCVLCVFTIKNGGRYPYGFQNVSNRFGRRLGKHHTRTGARVGSEASPDFSWTGSSSASNGHEIRTIFKKRLGGCFQFKFGYTIKSVYIPDLRRPWDSHSTSCASATSNT
jgi:hypothetical protein